MRVVCAWCKADLGYKAGPEGEVSHGICLPCQEKEMCRRPFSVKQRLVAVACFLGWLLLAGLVGDQDLRSTSPQYSAAVVRDWPTPLAPGTAQPEYVAHAARDYRP